MSEFTINSEIADKVGKLNISGSVVPLNWYRTILTEDDRPFFLAIAILADIVDGYRTVNAEDMESRINERKFEDGILRCSYTRYEEIFGVSHSTIKRALVELEKRELIRREFKSVIGEDERRINNAMYVWLNAEALERVTYPKELSERHVKKICREKKVGIEKRLEKDLKPVGQRVASELNTFLGQQVTQQQLEEGVIPETNRESSMEEVEAELQILFDELYNESSEKGYRESDCITAVADGVADLNVKKEKKIVRQVKDVVKVEEREAKVERVQQSFLLGIPFNDGCGNEQKIRMNIQVELE